MKKHSWLLACVVVLSIGCGGADRNQEYADAYRALVGRFDNAIANISRRFDAASRKGFPSDVQAKRELIMLLAAADAADFRELHKQATAIEPPGDFVSVHSAMVAYFDRFAVGMENTVQTFRSGRSQTESEQDRDVAALEPLKEKWDKEAKDAGLLPSRDSK